MEPIRPTLLLLIAMIVTAAGAEAQQEEASQEAYFRAVGEFFTVPSSELAILRDWRLAPDEIPVVLFVAERSGVSPEALVALRRSGQSWTELADRYGVGAAALHLPIPPQAPAGRLARLYEQFRSTPLSQWDGIRLEQRDIVALVNVRLLAQTLGIPPDEILARAGPAGSFVQLYGELIR